MAAETKHTATPDACIELTLADEAATLAAGERLARATFADGSALPGPEGVGTATAGGMFYLQGELGAGKTTLTRGILRGYGFQGAVKSPTYTLVEPYEFELCHIYHFDLYRLADPREVEFLGTESYFDASNLCLVEWPERGAGEIPPADVEITLTVAGAGRRLRIHALTARGAAMVARFSDQRLSS